MTSKSWWYALVLSVLVTTGAQGENMHNVVQRMFEAANRSDGVGLLECFTDDAVVKIVSMEFRGKKAILAFFQRDVWGGVYTVEKSEKKPYGEDVSLLFQPAGWTRPEPPILYAFTLRDQKIERLVGTYR